MTALLYIRLIGYTAGTLLMLFWMVVILGYRRQRNFERVLFFLCLALFLFYGGSLLALNAEIYYAQSPPVLTMFAWIVLCCGLLFLPPLVLHLHLEYAETRSLLLSRAWKRFWLAAAYAPAFYFALHSYPALVSGSMFDFIVPTRFLGRWFEMFLVVALWFSAYWEHRFAQATQDDRQTSFHLRLSGLLLGAGFLLLGPAHTPYFGTLLAFVPLLPLGALVYYVQRFNFLQIGRQQNLLYAVSVTFFALLYLSLVRRVGLWLEPILPPEASAAILLFVLVVFIEPLQRALGRRLKRTARREMDEAHRILAVIQEAARQGNQAKLVSFTEQWLKERLELDDAKLVFADANLTPRKGENQDKRSGMGWTFPIERGGQRFGYLHVRPHGAMLSGETVAALEFVSDQLPAAFELCRAIEEKLRLERELAERERLAALGQMAASISHNLKNPLGSIKTILQVQLENPEMTDSLKSETQMVLAEISRLSNKLAQLLQFSRPAVLSEAVSNCDAAEVVKEVTEVLGHEADRKAIHFQISSNGNLSVSVGKEALSDILSNLIVNALEAAPPNGKVTVAAAKENGRALIRVEDDGKGIPPDLREKVLQPFFTTKTQGTGLGLAIVAKRVAEANGTLELDSPIADGRGTRFSIWLPLREEGK